MSSFGSRDSPSNSPYKEEICCVIEDGERCVNFSSKATFSKKVKSLAQKRHNLLLDTNAGHCFICEHHRNLMHSLRAKRKRKDSEEENDYYPEVDFLQLQMNTLRRYKRHYKLQLKPGTNKIQLVEAISKHFKTIRVNEKKTLPLFVSMVKSHKSKLDQPKPLDA